MNRKKKNFNQRVKRFFCFILSLLMTVTGSGMTAFAKPDWPADTGIESEAGIVMDMDSKAVIFGQNIHVQKAPASITKLMTALVVIENSDLNDMVTFSHDAVYNVESGSGNKMSIEEGDTLSVEDCLYLLLLQSSNQAANALAEHVAGGRDAFVNMMNDRVKELGCENTHFANPSGLNDEAQLTTAYDMALIGTAAYNNEKLLNIGSAVKHKIPPTKNNPDGRSFAMEHKLVITTDKNSENYFPYAVAGKTGYTSIAGQTLVTYAKKDGRRLIAVTLKSNKKTHYKDTIALLDFAFKRFKNVSIPENEPEYVSGRAMIMADGREYKAPDLTMDENAVITLPANAEFSDAERKLETRLSEDAPKGAVAFLSYTYNDRKIGSVYLISEDKKLSEGSKEAAADPKKTENDKETNTEETNQQDGKKSDAKEKKDLSHLLADSRSVMAVTLSVVGAAAVIGGIIFLIKKKREKERRLLEERKARRRKRLEEIGCTEEEFKRMLEERSAGKK